MVRQVHLYLSHAVRLITMNMYPSINIHVFIKQKRNVTPAPGRVTRMNQCQVNCRYTRTYIYIYFYPHGVRSLSICTAPIIDHYRPDNKRYIDDDPIGRDVSFVAITMKQSFPVCHAFSRIKLSLISRISSLQVSLFVYIYNGEQ